MPLISTTEVDQLYLDNDWFRKKSDYDGSKRDEREARRCAAIGLASCLRANATAGGHRSTRTVPTPGSGAGSGPDIGGRAGASRPYRKYPEGELRRPAQVVARRSRRGIDVLYRLPGVALPSQNHKCGRDPQHRRPSYRFLRREPRPNGCPCVCKGLLANPKMISKRRGWRMASAGQSRVRGCPEEGGLNAENGTLISGCCETRGTGRR